MVEQGSVRVEQSGPIHLDVQLHVQLDPEARGVPPLLQVVLAHEFSESQQQEEATLYTMQNGHFTLLLFQAKGVIICTRQQK